LWIHYTVDEFKNNSKGIYAIECDKNELLTVAIAGWAGHYRRRFVNHKALEVLEYKCQSCFSTLQLNGGMKKTTIDKFGAAKIKYTQTLYWLCNSWLLKIEQKILKLSLVVDRKNVGYMDGQEDEMPARC